MSIFSMSVWKITIKQCPSGREPNFSSEPWGQGASAADSFDAYALPVGGDFALSFSQPHSSVGNSKTQVLGY